jgi:twitching motility protein PilT
MLYESKFPMVWTFERILKGARKHSASDIHLVRGLAPALRLNGDIRVLEGEPLDEHDLRGLLDSILNEQQRKILEEKWQLCFSRLWPELGRYRASVYYRAGCPELAIRLCETKVRSREDLGLPPAIDELVRLPNGLILVTGPTGVGKTTTLNYMVDLINRERRAKIITIEDPIEFVHDNLNSIVVQQEVHTDTPSFKDALIHVLRLDPDVVVIGEMRDLETIGTAMTAAETGHLVLATLHTPDAVQTVQRIFSVFPSEQQNNIKYQLSNTIQAVIAQQLLPKADGSGQILATEVLTASAAVRKQIREGNAHLLYGEMQTGRKRNMQTMDHCLLELYQKGEITYDVAVSFARDAQAIRNRNEMAASSH